MPYVDIPVLETIHASHYVEKVRWCLDYARIKYREEQDIGILGVLTTGRRVPTLRVPSKNISVSNSSDILRYVYGANYADMDEKTRRFFEPTPEAVRLEKKFDRLGEDLRRCSQSVICAV